MKKIHFLLLALFAVATLHAHDIRTGHSKEGLRAWHLKNGKHLHAYFLLSREDQLVLERPNGQTMNLKLAELSEGDRAFVQEKVEAIRHINQHVQTTAKAPAISQTASKQAHTGSASFWLWVCLAGSLFGLMPGLVLNRFRRHRENSTPSFSRLFPKGRAATLTLLGVFLVSGLLLYAENVQTRKATSAGTNPAFLDSAFAPFKPSVATRWDTKYFYVESNGIPAHNMMVGITSWQQQVPLPQCYNGTNAWSIPLNPLMATIPVPVNNKHFLRGAIALAANGIPIFNPYTNTGVDAFLDGQLDQWGGHSGRADDYHYHNAPMFLENQSGPITPIAFALDGFAVYGNKEPDGSAMKALDANHGHWGPDGRYHYHGTAAAPYMIGQMAGVVTEDTTLQIVPQPAAKGVRPALTPLKGATITGFHPNGSTGYTLIYTLNGATDSVVYKWTSTGAYTYDFYTSSGKTTSNYQGKAPCMMPSGIRYLNAGSVFEVFPNPAAQRLSLSLGAGMRETDIVCTFMTDLNGRVVWKQSGFAGNVNLNGARSGIYLLSIETKSGRAVRSVVVQP